MCVLRSQWGRPSFQRFVGVKNVPNYTVCSTQKHLSIKRVLSEFSLVYIKVIRYYLAVANCVTLTAFSHAGLLSANKQSDLLFWSLTVFWTKNVPNSRKNVPKPSLQVWSFFATLANTYTNHHYHLYRKDLFIIYHIDETLTSSDYPRARSLRENIRRRTWHHYVTT